MTAPKHPLTGLHYAFVVPDAWGAFVDIYAMHERLSQARDYVTLMTQAQWFQLVDAGQPDSALFDPQTLFVLWDAMLPVPVREARGALVTSVYSEALSLDTKLMLPAHVEQLARFEAQARDGHDAIFAHTPWMASQLGRVAPAHVLPVGYDESVMGSPRFGTAKHHGYAFYGSVVGKRALVLPWLQQRLGSQLHNVSGAFGKRLMGELENCHASLYVAHSDVDSFSTWRLWQTFATSAALVAEPGDSWPAVPGEHFVKLDRITFANAEIVAGDLERILREVDLGAVARRAHEEIARHYTIDRCFDEYLVPASVKMLEARGR